MMTRSINAGIIVKPTRPASAPRSDCPDTAPSRHLTCLPPACRPPRSAFLDPAAPVCQPDGTCGECTPPDLDACAAGEVCEPTEHVCVECVSSSDCPDTEPSCNDTTNTCEGCDTDADCTEPPAPVCQPDGTCGEIGRAHV